MAEEKKAVELNDEALDEVAGGGWRFVDDKAQAIRLLNTLSGDKYLAALKLYNEFGESDNTYKYDDFKAEVDKL